MQCPLPLQKKSIPDPKAGVSHDLYLKVPDSDQRAVAYVAGTAPNKWGFMADGSQALQAPTENSVSLDSCSE